MSDTSRDGRLRTGVQTPLNRSTASHRFTWLACVLIAAFGFTMFLPGISGQTRVLTYHEVLFAQPAREMIASGDWVIAHFLDEPWEHKPPGNVWLLALSMALFGHAAEWVARLPAVCCGVLTACCAGLIATRWFGRLTGIAAGCMVLTSGYLLALARLAEADMPLVAAVTAAMTLFACWTLDSPRGRHQRWWMPPLFYLIVGASAVLKVIGPVFVLGACGVFMLIRRDRHAMRMLLNPPGLLLFLLTLAAWPVAAYLQWPGIVEGDVWRHHLLRRFTGGMGAPRPWYFYLYDIPLATLPWSPWAAYAVFRARRAGAMRHPLAVLFMCWLGVGFVFLTLSQWKWWHYAAPLMPPVTVAAAVGLMRDMGRRHAASNPATWRFAAGWVAILIAVVVLLNSQKPWRYGASIVLAVLAAGLVVVYVVERRRRIAASLAALFAVAWVTVVAGVALGLPHFDSYRTYAQLADRTNQRLDQGQMVYLIGIPESQITYYIGRPMRRFDTVDAFCASVTGDDAPRHFAITQRHLIAALGDCAIVAELDANDPPRPKHTPDQQLVLVRLTPKSANE